MLRVVCLASAAALCAVPQAPSGAESRWTRERVWFARLSREDLDRRLRKGVASEGVNRFDEKLSAEIVEALADSGGGCIWIGGEPLEKRTRIVGIGAGGAQRMEEVEKKLKAIRFRVDWLEVTGLEVETNTRGFSDFHEIGGVFHGLSDREHRFLVPHLPEVKSGRLLAVAARAGGGKVLWDPIPLEVVSGDPGVGGIKLQQALDGLSGVRLVLPGANADRFTVEVEMRELPEMALRAAVRKGHSVELRDLGAPSTPVLERLKKAGIEVREAR